MTLGQPSVPCSPAMYALVTALADATGEAREMELRRKWLDGSHDQAVVEAEGTAWTALTVAIGEVEAREAALTAEVERLTRDLASARADAANARAVATEAIDTIDEAARYIAGDGELIVDKRTAGIAATLRARLASPEPAKEP